MNAVQLDFVIMGIVPIPMEVLTVRVMLGIQVKDAGQVSGSLYTQGCGNNMHRLSNVSHFPDSTDSCTQLLLTLASERYKGFISI